MYVLDCDSGRIRTYDQLIKSQLLCQLSYGAIKRLTLYKSPANNQAIKSPISTTHPPNNLSLDSIVVPYTISQANFT